MKSRAVAANGQYTQLWFKYDYMGRRYYKKSIFQGVTTQLYYLYDGWNLVAELNASGTLLRDYTYGVDPSDGAGAGALLCMTNHVGSTKHYNYLHNSHGDVVGFTNSSGTIIGAYEYDPYGKQIRSEDTAGTENPFGYSGQYTDKETGLVYYGKRYYNPSMGRFINKDPIGLDGGHNLYAFVGNNPLNSWDVRGMRDWAQPNAWQGVGHEEEEQQKEEDDIYKLPAYEVTSEQWTQEEEDARQEALSEDAMSQYDDLHGFDDWYNNQQDEINKMLDMAKAYGIDITQNYKDAKKAGKWFRIDTFVINVKSGGSWDYKSNKLFSEAMKALGYSDHDIQAFGNFHFGIVANAFGFDMKTSLAGAAIYQVVFQGGGSASDAASFTFLAFHEELGYKLYDSETDSYKKYDAINAVINEEIRTGDNDDDSDYIMEGWNYAELNY